jgi:transposase InsO family protein
VGRKQYPKLPSSNHSRCGCPGVKPRIISDNGSQFIANDFKAFGREYGLKHSRTSPYYPQSNGKLERWHGSLTSECIRPGSPATKKGADSSHSEVRKLLQHRPIGQRDWIHYSGRLPCRAQRGDRKRTRLKAGIGLQIASRKTLQRNKLPSGFEAITTKVLSRRIKLCRGATRAS